ncbi:hypothetical protein [Micromonospora tarensis]|uniref:Uncharacterized protein n=1 Tax=Micromonospora tarensis TaxID=2806100 RepID=A0ABS1YFB7_9ACTN|nr:hypothetical protein [Micromonospora tarensis]MBM0276057.1 hypothetical protein [Micromonospora tarensis]
MIIAALVTYLVKVGLDKADKIASSIGVVLALVALGVPYLLPRAGGPTMRDLDRVQDTGTATATAGGRATSGVDTVGDDRPAHVVRSGDASADGPGSVANTGIQRRPRT